MLEMSWDMPPATLSLSINEVHVWRVSLAQSALVLPTLEALLSPGELQRARRFHFERDQRRYIVSQGHLRLLLGQYLKREPRQIEFCQGTRGKPALAASSLTPDAPGDLRFNLSHSHELALYAFAWNREVGIDVEHIRPVADRDQIVRRFFAPQEQAVFFALPDDQRTEAFFQCWTRKEAFIKAIGEGLYHPLDHFVVAFVPGEPARLLDVTGHPEETGRWSVQALAPAPDYAAALFVDGQDWRLRCWHMY
jgi:4'-phosphopantetheinyl transferase